MKTFAKVFRIIFLVWGAFIFGGMLAMVIVPSGREALFKDSPIPEPVRYPMVAAIMALGLFLVIYNILCLKKGIDIFFWMIFKREAYRNGDYKKPKSTYKSSSGGSSYSNSPRPSSPRPSSPKKSYDFDWSDLEIALEKVSRTQIWGFNAYIEVDDVDVSETGEEYTFRIKVDFRAYGSATIKDEVDASRFKSASQSAIKAMCQRINDKTKELHDRYGFGFTTSFGDIKDDVSYSSY